MLRVGTGIIVASMILSCTQSRSSPRNEAARATPPASALPQGSSRTIAAFPSVPLTDPAQQGTTTPPLPQEQGGTGATSLGAATLFTNGAPFARSLAARFSDVANVRDFGAIGNGVANDTTAIQAAIDSFGPGGGPVFFPPGTYRILSTLLLHPQTQVLGSGMAYSPPGEPSPTGGTIIDASLLKTDPAIAGSFRNGGVRLERFTLIGPLSPDLGPNNTGIKTALQDGRSAQVVIDQVRTVGFYTGLDLYNCIECAVRDSIFSDARNCNIYIQAGDAIHLRNALASNVGSGAGTQGLDVANIRIDWNARRVVIDVPVVDELFAVSDESPTSGNTIRIIRASRVHVRGSTVWYSALGANVGISLGDGVNNPTDCLLDNVRVEPFSSGAPVNTIVVHGSGHVLRNVKTNANGGGDILDDSTGTTYENVNGRWKLPGLPASDPGPGSKQLWYDPADGNRVKFSP